jgi:NADPH-dependent 2,4-dienoyl-CoA reductase/sulfur reductase-like enzyme
MDVRLHHDVHEIDLPQGRLRVLNKKTHRDEWAPFDHLMLATGALPIKPPIEGIESEGIFGVGNLESGLRLQAYIEKFNPEKAVVIGGGYIGLELAENLQRLGMQVSLVEKAEEVMGTLDADMGKLVSEALVENGIALYRNEGLEGFDLQGGRVQGIVTEQRTLPAELVVLGMGVRPNTTLAEQADIKIGNSGGIAVDDSMQTSVARVWSGGDCAESYHLVSEQPVSIALGTVANKHGRVAGTNIGGGDATFPGVVGTAVTKFHDVEIARTGLQEKEIRKIGKDFVSAVIESSTLANYFPASGPITVKVLAEKDSGKLLGGQIVGKRGAAKRIDILATALHAGFTVEEVENLDLSYAPPISPLWDPVAIAARVAGKKL